MSIYIKVINPLLTCHRSGKSGPNISCVIISLIGGIDLKEEVTIQKVKSESDEKEIIRLGTVPFLEST